MAKIKAAKASKEGSKLSALASSPKLLAVLGKVAGNKALLSKAKANPRAFLLAQKIKVPAGIDIHVVKLTQRVNSKEYLAFCRAERDIDTGEIVYICEVPPLSLG